MLKVTIEFYPGGSEVGKSISGTAYIANDATGTESLGNYQYVLRLKSGKVHKRGRVRGFRRQRLNAWQLLRLVLEDAYRSAEEVRPT